MNWMECGKEVIKAVLMCVCCYVWCLGLCQSLLMRDLPCWAWLVCRKCSKKTVAEGVDSLMSVLFSNRVKPCLRVVTMIVFVNEMLLMIAGDVERNPGPGESIAHVICQYCFTATILSIYRYFINKRSGNSCE